MSSIEADEEMPGGPMANRPVHFFWLLDCSGSMMGNKISELNFAIREALPEMQSAAKSNPAAKLMVRALTFNTGASWHDKQAIDVASYSWKDVHADGVTDMGAAFHLVARELGNLTMPQRALRPVLALISDGGPTDDYRAGLRSIEATPWGQRAVRIAIAIGNDADRSMLKEFLNNPELEPLLVHNAGQLASAIRWASTMAVKAASNAAPNTNSPLSNTGQQWQAPPTTDDEDVW
ncbi:MAG TPA: hypothetical protein VGS97_09500 [Actinocrinis sp.]|nr:hypothetical protein [Actinocrinis sp.]HEV2344315.1 hypothetical protein [Actinocrinis sp.]